MVPSCGPCLRAISQTQAAEDVSDKKLGNPGGAQSRSSAAAPRREEPDEVSSSGRLSDERQKLFPQAGSEMSSVCDVESYFTN